MWLEIGLVVLTLFLALYRWITRNFGKWEALGVPCVPGRFPHGSHSELLTAKKHFNDLIQHDYHNFKQHKVSGFYMLGKPVLVINDIELIRDVMVKDFDHFVDRQGPDLGKIFQGGPMDTMWARQLTNLSGDAWKDIRSTFTPIFTSGKMKTMVRFIQEVSQSLTNELGRKADAGEDFEAKEVYGKFSLDTLASCAFGINPKSFESESNIFVKMAARIFKTTMMDNLLIVLRFIPGMVQLHQALGIDVIKPRSTKFFIDIVRDTIRQRRMAGTRRNDLIDMMIDCIKDPDSVEQQEETTEQYQADMRLEHTRRGGKLDEDAVIATAMVMLVAGYDTTGMTLAFMTYYLAEYPDIQSRLREEIEAAYEDNDGKLPDYQTIQELPYLEQCILETLRMFTPVGVIMRACVKDYTVPGTNIQVKVNDLVAVPASGLHRDPDIYPEPTLFNPDHFSKEARQGRSPYTFQAFGQGPRACIGMRFAMLEVKMAMMEVLHHFHIHKSDKNPEKHTTDPESDLGYVKEGLYVKLSRRN